MNIDKAIEILELHNKWRRDNERKYIMAEPKELGTAIDTVVSWFKNLKRKQEGCDLADINNCPNCGSVDIDKEEFFCNNCSEYYND